MHYGSFFYNSIILIFSMQTDLTLYIKKIFLLALILCGFYILYILSSIVLMLVISGFLTILINPLADK